MAPIFSLADVFQAQVRLLLLQLLLAVPKPSLVASRKRQDSKEGPESPSPGPRTAGSGRFGPQKQAPKPNTDAKKPSLPVFNSLSSGEAVHVVVLVGRSKAHDGRELLTSLKALFSVLLDAFRAI